MPSKHKQAYPPRKRLKYKKDLPWEVEEEPMDPELYAQLSPRMKAYVDNEPYIKLTPEELAERKAECERQDRAAAPRIRITLLILYLFMSYAVGNNLLFLNPQRDGWISTIIGGAIHLAVLCVPICGIFSVLKEFLVEDADKS